MRHKCYTHNSRVWRHPCLGWWLTESPEAEKTTTATTNPKQAHPWMHGRPTEVVLVASTLQNCRWSHEHQTRQILSLSPNHPKSSSRRLRRCSETAMASISVVI